MQCRLCGHPKVRKHGKTSKGSQRYICPNCQKTFTETFDTLYYRRQITPDEVHTILQSHVEGSSLRGIARIVKRSYRTVINLVKMAGATHLKNEQKLGRLKDFNDASSTQQ